MFALGKIKHLEKGKRHFASFSSKENFKKAQFIEHSLAQGLFGFIFEKNRLQKKNFNDHANYFGLT